MKWGYDLTIYEEMRVTISIAFDIATHCHMLLTGASGSGKSYGLLYLIGELIKACSDIVIYIVDFKNSEDFAFLHSYENYYSGYDCYTGIMEYYNSFTNARIQGNNKVRHILICDEYPAFINFLQLKDKQDKTKLSNDILSAISEILMLGRGISYGIWIVTQRADSSLFINGARDNFMIVIGLGKMSREQKGMLFTGEDIPDRIYKLGEGLILADGHGLKEVKYPYISNINNWKRHILKSIKLGGGA